MRHRLTPTELEQALAFKLIVIARGCEVHDDLADCDGPVQAAHVISKQTLRRRGLHQHVYDPRNGIGACYKAHRRSDNAVERFPVDRVPVAAWEFAHELGLDYLLERLYGERVA